MDLMTGGAGKLVVAVGAALPEHQRFIFAVALETVFCRHLGVDLGRVEDRCLVSRCGVIASRTVAGLAAAFYAILFRLAVDVFRKRSRQIIVTLLALVAADI